MFIKIAVQTIPPLSLAFGRVALAAIVVAVYSKLMGDRLPRDRATWMAAAVVGFIGNALPYSLIHWGERFVDSSLTAILMGVMPVAVALMAHFATQSDPLTARRGLGIAVGFLGLVVLIGWEALGGLGSQIVAQLAIVAAALSYSVTTIFVRRVPHLSGRPMALATLIWGGDHAVAVCFGGRRPVFIVSRLVRLGFAADVRNLFYWHRYADVFSADPLPGSHHIFTNQLSDSYSWRGLGGVDT